MLYNFKISLVNTSNVEMKIISVLLLVTIVDLSTSSIFDFQIFKNFLGSGKSKDPPPINERSLLDIKTKNDTKEDGTETKLIQTTTYSKILRKVSSKHLKPSDDNDDLVISKSEVEPDLERFHKSPLLTKLENAVYVTESQSEARKSFWNRVRTIATVSLEVINYLIKICENILEIGPLNNTFFGTAKNAGALVKDFMSKSLSKFFNV